MKERLKNVSGEVFVVLGTILVALAFYLVFTWGDKAVMMTEITVVKKMDNSEAGNSDYRVISESGEEFTVRNAESQGFYAASKVFRMLEVGKTYQVLVTGRRIPLFSIKRNIIEAVPLP
ncbi:MAG: hypothetical protein JW697_09480 [Kosmotogaceae bacterium]|nr:hypothetical protein [Kosmotogaceae bacterium]